MNWTIVNSHAVLSHIDSVQGLSAWPYLALTVNPLKGRGINWLHFAIQI